MDSKSFDDKRLTYYTESVKVHFFPEKSQYKHPEEYGIPMVRNTVVFEDYEMQEKINELKKLCKRGRPYYHIPRFCYNKNFIKDLDRISRNNIEKIVDYGFRIKQNYNKFLDRA